MISIAACHDAVQGGIGAFYKASGLTTKAQMRAKMKLLV